MDDEPDEPDEPRPRRTRLAAWWRPNEAELLGVTVLLVGALVASGLWWWQATRLPESVPIPLAQTPQDVRGADAAGEAAPAGEGGGDVVVFVSGAVLRPGIVSLAGSPRVADAIVAAGGLADDAAAASLNLARRVSDGEQVHVPAEGEAPGPPLAGDPTAGVGPAVVDLNHASAEELGTLPGIGPVRAAAIVEHRARQGPFREPGDLRDVPGIGEATFQRLAPHVRVG